MQRPVAKQSTKGNYSVMVLPDAPGMSEWINCASYCCVILKSSCKQCNKLPDSVIFMAHITFILFHHESRKGKKQARGFYFSLLVLTVIFNFKGCLPCVFLLTILALPNCLWSFQGKEIYLTSNKVEDYCTAMCHGIKCREEYIR